MLHSPRILSEKLTQTFIYAIVCVCIFTAYPYVFTQFLPIPSVKAMAAIDIVLICTIMVYIGKMQQLPKNFNFIVGFQLLCWIFFFLIHHDTIYFTRLFLIIASYLALLLLYNSRGGIVGFAKFYNNIILWMAIGGVITFFLVLIFNIHPIFEFENADSRLARLYGLTCTNVQYGRFIRYAGFFDEPGAMATWGMYALIINRLFIKDIKYENRLIVLLAFTFSMSYYIQLLLFLFFFRIKSLKSIIIAASIILTVSFIIYNSQNTEYDQLYKLTFERFEFDQSAGKLNGDNRSGLAEIAKKEFIKSPLIGQGPTQIANIGYMGDNPYTNLATDGIIGTIIMYFPILCVLLLRRKRIFFYAILILMIGYLQRPIHPLFIHSFILYLFTLLAIIKSDCQVLNSSNYVTKYN